MKRRRPPVARRCAAPPRALARRTGLAILAGPGCHHARATLAELGRALALLAVVALLACAGGGPSQSGTEGSSTSETTAAAEPVPLVDVPAWQTVAAINDPLADHRPDPDVCPVGSVFVEGVEVEIDTNFCTYAMLRWPALVDVPAGSEVTLSFRHYDLIAAAPATAHVALIVGTTILWERSIAIPGPAEVLNETVTVAEGFPVGTPVYFHLHNHGQNNYILSTITTTPP